MSTARKFHQIKGDFKMRHGSITDPVVAYETWGELNTAKDNAVLLFTGLSPSAHAASSPLDPSTGWWEQMIGPDMPIDTSEHFVICVNSLGSCFGSTGPASVNPSTGKVYDLDFPVLTIEDIANAGQAVIDSLGIETLYSVVGASMGGMCSLIHNVMYPQKSKSLVCISSAARALPFTIALRSLQREVIRSDPSWLGGRYPSDTQPVSGMRLARKLGMLTYRSAVEFEQRFGRERSDDEHEPGNPFGIDFEIESYLEAHANKFIGSFDANCYLYLSRAMDLFDIADHGGSLKAAFDKAGASRILIVGSKTDFLFPISQQRELAEGLAGKDRELKFEPVSSIQGHDSFLVDMDNFRPVICDFFNCSLS